MFFDSFEAHSASNFAQDDNEKTTAKEKDRAVAVLWFFFLYFYFSGLREFICIRGRIVLHVK